MNRHRLHTLAKGAAATLVAFFATAGSALAQAAETAQITKPKLEITIPGVTISDIVRSGQTVNIPWIGEYLVGIYRYSIGVGAALASVMMVIGGVNWLMGDPSKGKKRIQQALIGLGVLLGAYLILSVVNPELVNLKPIQISSVEGKRLELVPAGDIAAATGSTPLERAAMLSLIREKATARGDEKFACFVKGSVMFESGGRGNVVGHDEHAAITAFPVKSRRDFINSGYYYSSIKSGKKEQDFPPVGCNDKSCQTQGPKTNDDRLDLSAPPDYGLDWRFSHGFGSGQSTIFPNSAPCPGREAEGRGFRMSGKCYTIPDLMDTEKQVEAMLDHYQACYAKTNGGTNPGAGYTCYGGGSFKDNPEWQKRIDAYNNCAAQVGTP